MKHFFAIALLTVLPTLFSFTPPSEASLEVDVETSTLTWKGYKVTGSHEGYIYLKSGTLDYEDGKLVGGNFEVDMTTINCTDLEGKMKNKLEGHLRSDD